ncbi:unnamed protein product [Paramecium sonneborni]|uniref:Uncharacterized protein n=1 Tax=Paramecium sonneborni TaxID=65129 RepID=A0A8S1N3Y5_9CILI|nr:unnamed protein product [Paramecium sonneborni]
MIQEMEINLDNKGLKYKKNPFKSSIASIKDVEQDSSKRKEKQSTIHYRKQKCILKQMNNKNIYIYEKTLEDVIKIQRRY